MLLHVSRAVVAVIEPLRFRGDVYTPPGFAFDTTVIGRRLYPSGSAPLADEVERKPL
jgi:hypothetical protein